MTENTNEEILTRAVGALISLIDICNMHDMQFIAESEILQRLNVLIFHDHVPLRMNTLRVFIETASKLKTEQKGDVLEYNLLQHISSLSTKEISEDDQEKLMENLLRILKFEETSTQAVLNAQLIPFIIENLPSNKLQRNINAATAIYILLSKLDKNCLIQLYQFDFIATLCLLIELDQTVIAEVRVQIHDPYIQLRKSV